MSSAKRIKVAQESSSNSPSNSHDIKHIDELPQELFQHCLEFVGKGNFAFVAPVSKHFYWNYISMGVPIKNNMLTVDVFLQLGRNKYTSAEVIAIGSMRLAIECFLKAPYDFKEAICRHAAVNGRLDVLNCGVFFGEYQVEVMLQEIFGESQQALHDIVVNGHSNVIQFLHENGINFNYNFRFFKDVLTAGHASTLHWMCTEGILDPGKIDIASSLARGGELDILKEYYEDDISENVFLECAKGGHIEVMNWMLDIEPEACHWNEFLFCGAAESGSIPMMELCLRNGCPKTFLVCIYTMNNENKVTALNALKWLRQNNVPWSTHVCASAAKNRNLEALTWARENGCPWGIETFRNSVYNGDIEFLDYCFEHDCPFHSSLYEDAFNDGLSAESQSFKVCQWLIQHSIPMNEKTSYNAALHGHLSTLKLVLDNGCPIRNDMLSRTVFSRNLRILDNLVKNHLPQGQNIYTYSIEMEDCSDANIIEVLQLFHDNDIPWNNEITLCAQSLELTNVVRWLKCNGCSQSKERSFLDKLSME